MQRRVRAVFVRGGTSRALIFHHRDLPGDREAWNPIFLAALGSPDPNGRQLDGLGGGISSLSKVAVVGPATRADADVDYTFGQVEVTRAAVDYRGNCGNISSAIGPFAIDEALVAAREAATVVRIHNTNTRKLIHAHVPVDAGQAAVQGDFTLDGVPGTGARIALDFLDPGGAVTGQLLPTGRAQDTLEVPGLAAIAASLVDATNPMVFVRAKDLGLDGHRATRGPRRPARATGAARGDPGRRGRPDGPRANPGGRGPHERRRAEDRDPRAAGRVPNPRRRDGRAARRRPRGAHRVDGEGPPGVRADRCDVPRGGDPHPGDRRSRGRRPGRQPPETSASAIPPASCRWPPPFGPAPKAPPWRRRSPCTAPRAGSWKASSSSPDPSDRGGNRWQRPDASS